MPQQKEGLVYTSSTPMEINNQRQYQQAYIVPTTKLKKEAVIHAAYSIKNKVDNTPQVGNEQADKLAKHGAEQQQEENRVCYTEMKSIIKYLFNTPQQEDSYHQLTRSEQTTIFRLRTGHNRLNQHLYKVMKVVPSPMCPCGEAEQNTAHLLQSCNIHQALRDNI
ncbi:unnamed protein product [Mytilus coruscus]|uniref:Reverse transcriptase zinc-binding domain-containing protein n=1 Tax=Mytilus coruscus TaxID=42192 RepID=A0A6J8AUG5_MYTCO|nr:unnamed protein product [Mytilus coruscus]